MAGLSWKQDKLVGVVVEQQKTAVQYKLLQTNTNWEKVLPIIEQRVFYINNISQFPKKSICFLSHIKIQNSVHQTWLFPFLITYLESRYFERLHLQNCDICYHPFPIFLIWFFRCFGKAFRKCYIWFVAYFLVLYYKAWMTSFSRMSCTCKSWLLCVM